MVAFLIFLTLLALALIALIIVSYYLAPKRPTEVKTRRFEAGGPPFGEVKRRLIAQYMGYIYLVTVVEALVGVMIVAYLARPIPSEFAVAAALALVLIALFVARHLRLLADVKKWA